MSLSGLQERAKSWWVERGGAAGGEICGALGPEGPGKGRRIVSGVEWRVPMGNKTEEVFLKDPMEYGSGVGHFPISRAAKAS